MFIEGGLKMKKSVYILFVMILMVACKSNDEGIDGDNEDHNYEEKVADASNKATKLEIEVSDYIRIFEGRLGLDVELEYGEHVEKIIDLVTQLEYIKTESYDGGAGSSYNLIFESEEGEVISKMSFGWPESKVLIDDTYYYFEPEYQYLLYAYIADACFIEMAERNEACNSLYLDVEDVKNENMELSKEVENLEEDFVLYKNEIMTSDLDFYWDFVWDMAFSKEGAISEKVIEDINVLLQPIIRLDDEEGSLKVNPLQGFFYSNYEEVNDIDLSAFLLYCPVSDSQYDDRYLEEFEELKSHENWPFGETVTYDSMPVPIHRFRAEVIEELFVKYAGITLNKLNGIDSKDLIYLESMDAYYNFTSDLGPGGFRCSSGSLEGNVLTLYGDTIESGPVLTIVKEGENYYIRSYVS